MKTDKLLAQNFTEDHPAEAALILERLAPDEASAYLDELPPRLSEQVLQRMVTSHAAECMALLAPQRFEQVISTLPLNRAAAILRHLDPERQAELLQKTPSSIAALLHHLLRYPEASAGALMDPRVLALPEDITATEALARVRRTPRHVLYYLYIVNRDQKLIGVMNLRELMMASPRATLQTAMRREVITLPALANHLAIIEHPGWRDVHALPVVDRDGVFLGVLRYQTLRKLQRDSESPPQTSGALAVVLTLGELCWVGFAGVLTDLTTHVVTPPGPIDRGKGPADD
jgi:magnesium transporter